MRSGRYTHVFFHVLVSCSDVAPCSTSHPEGFVVGQLVSERHLYRLPDAVPLVTAIAHCASSHGMLRTLLPCSRARVDAKGSVHGRSAPRIPSRPVQQVTWSRSPGTGGWLVFGRTLRQKGQNSGWRPARPRRNAGDRPFGRGRRPDAGGRARTLRRDSIRVEVEK